MGARWVLRTESEQTPTLSSPDDALWVPPRHFPVECVIEDAEGLCDALALHPRSRLLLLFEQGVGDEVGHLQQEVGCGVPKGPAADGPLYGDVLRPFANLPDVVPAGEVVASPARPALRTFVWA